MRTGHAPGTYKAYRFFDEGWLILFNEQGTLRLIDGAVVHKHKQAAYRKAAELNKEKNTMSKQVVEFITREGRFISEVETRYSDGTRSRGAVNKFDKEGAARMLEEQLAGDTPTEPWDRNEEDHHMEKRTSGVVEERLRNRQ